MSHQFLETVLPAHGRYCVVAIDDTHKQIKRQTFVDSISEVESFAQQCTHNGWGAFFALAAFTGNTRKADEARGLQALFLDVDCGPGKPYDAAPAGATALRAFVDANQLPMPTIVMSGGGLHVYWALTRELSVAEWRPLARALKALCVSSSMHIDMACTTDAARVLRIPGSTNFKHGQQSPVHIVRAGVSVAPETLAALLPVEAAPVDLSAAKAYAVDDTTRALAASDRRPSRFRLIVERKACAQVLHCVANAAELEEPMWRAALSVAWNCEDAESAIQAVSEGHPGYTYEATLEKAQRLTSKPYTCAWFRENAPARCEGCTAKVTSPIQLGEYVAEAPTTEDGEYEVEAALVPDTEPHATVVKVRIPELPWPYFRAATGGIYRKQKNEDGEETTPTEIYPQDLYITSRFYDSDEHGDGEGELVAINLHLPHDGLRRFHVPVIHLMTKDKLRDVLVKHGVITYGNGINNIMAYFAESIRKLQSKFASSKTRSQMGWTPEGTFVVGDLEYTPAGVNLAPPASGTRQLAPHFRSKGTIEAWREIINFYGRPGMEGHAFAFLVGLGSPLLQLLNATQVRGAVLNLVSNGSGTGKTTVQHAINSIYGHPVDLLMEAKDTAASRFHRLGVLNSICMTVDELTNASGEQLSELVYGSTSGRARHRMESSSNKLRNNHTSWCSVTVTSSNAVMSDALAAHRTAVEGELKRVIDLRITTPDGIPKAETDALFSQLATNFGVAGPAFIQHVVANREVVEAALKEMQLKIDSDAKFQRNDRFYSAVCTMAMVGGMIGNKLGLFDLPLKRIYAYAIAQVGAVRDANSDTVGDARTMALELLSKFVSENVNNTLIVHPSASAAVPGAATPVRGALKMRYEVAADELVILASDLREYFVARRVDFRSSLNEFRAMGALQISNSGDPSIVRRIAAGAIGALNAPPARCYVFKGSMLGVKLELPSADT